LRATGTGSGATLSSRDIRGRRVQWTCAAPCRPDETAAISLTTARMAECDRALHSDRCCWLGRYSFTRVTRASRRATRRPPATEAVPAARPVLRRVTRAEAAAETPSGVCRVAAAALPEVRVPVRPAGQGAVARREPETRPDRRIAVARPAQLAAGVLASVHAVSSAAAEAVFDRMTIIAATAPPGARPARCAALDGARRVARTGPNAQRARCACSKCARRGVRPVTSSAPAGHA
jgi:hypothetical protein